MHKGQMGVLRTALFAFTLLLALMPLNVRADEVDPFGFIEDDYSSWGIVDAPYPFEGYDKDGKYIGYGCFPVGNGLVFAHLGVDGDFNTLRGITGPGYKTRDEEGKPVWWQEGEWPDIKFELHAAKCSVESDLKYSADFYKWHLQSVRQIRGAPLVYTYQLSKDFELHGLTYAVPEMPVIVREFCVVGEMPRHYSHGGFLLRFPDLREDESGYFLTSGSDRLYVSNLCGEMHRATPEHSLALYGVNDVFNSVSAAHFAVALIAVDAASTSDLHLPPIEQLRQSALDYWRSWSAQNRQFDTGNKRLDDMLTQIPVIIETQRDAYSGGVSPMVSYHGYWVRDHNGPILTYLANGRFEEVLRMLRYHRAACLNYGHCSMLVPLDLDLSDLPGWKPDAGASTGRGEAMLRPDGIADQDDGRSTASPLQTLRSAGDLSHIGTAPEDWEGVTVEHAEVPSWIVLQHYWLWRAMHTAGRGEEADEFIREAWPFISHNLFGMPVDPIYGVRFHGDETYTGGALYSTYDREESGAIGYPNGYIPTEFFSFDNTLIQLVAARSCTEMAQVAGNAADGEHAQVLHEELNEATYRYELDHWWSPAYVPVMNKPWPTPFSNVCLRPFWLNSIERGLAASRQDVPGLFSPAAKRIQLSQHFAYLQAALWGPLWLPGSTPWSTSTTGNNFGYWLAAATEQGDQRMAKYLLDYLDNYASPEGAWCEVLNGELEPVSIYGRVNRIRPWESGINYFAIVQYLKQVAGHWRTQDRTTPWLDGRPLVSINLGVQPATSVLAITREDDCLDRLGNSPSLSEFEPREVALLDAAIPFLHFHLRQALIEEGTTGGLQLRIPYLFIDTGVRDGLDRRTFKDHDFWYGGEMTRLLQDYEAAGGVIIFADETGEAQ